MSGVFGLLLAKQLTGRGIKHDKTVIDSPPLPAWYSRWRFAIWLLTAAAIYLIPYANNHLGIAQSFLIPALALPWPLNGLFAWVLSFGLVAWIMVLAGWEQRRKKGWIPALVAVLSEAYFSAVSSLSRVTYIFHTVPYIWVLVTRHLTWEWKRLLIPMILIIWVLLFVAALQAVMVARYFPVYTAEIPTVAEIYTAEPDSVPVATTAEKAAFEPLRKASLLVVDRWIGLEGVMAVVGYPEKGFDLLAMAASERRTSGKLDLFTDEIAKVYLSDDVLRHTQYASIPGAVAFSYYTGSLVVVLLGVAALTSVLIGSERFILRLTQNPYLTGFWSMSLAHTVASFGLGLIQTASFYLVCVAFMVLVWLLQGRQGLNRVKNA